jgi:amino acid adenylation domain-containing protein
MGRSKLVENLLSAASLHAARPAVRTGDVAHSYEQLVGFAGGLAHRLTQSGAPGDRCAVLGRRSLAAYGGFLACLLAERVYLPLSPHDPARRMADTLKRGRCGTLIADRASLAQAAPLARAHPGLRLLILPDVRRGAVGDLDLDASVAVICADDLDATLAPPPATLSAPDAEGAYLIFTSGSTGTPKGVLVPARAAQSYVEAMRPVLALEPQDRVSQVFDPGFDLSVHDMLMAWDAGAQLCPLPEAQRFRPGEAVRDLNLTVWFSVPSTISVMGGLGQLKPDLLGGLRTSLFCGEALRMSDVDLWRAAAPASRLLNLYGPTEATIAASAHEVVAADAPCPTAPIGRPLPGLAYVLLDPDSDDLASGAEGELGIGGPQLALGYWDDPDLTEQRFPTLSTPQGAQRIYRTGDRVRRLDDGDYLYLGRLDNEIKIAGAYRLNLLEVENAVAAAAGARACAVVVSDGRSRARSTLTAFLVDAVQSDHAVRESLRQSHPTYMIPEAFRRLAVLPALPNGKVDRHALLRMAVGETEGSQAC